MKNALGSIAIIAYIAVAIVQFVAMVGGLASWIGSTFLAVLISFVFGGLPVIGTIAGIYHSVNAWDWNIWLAILFFCFPLVLMIIGGLGAILVEKCKDWLNSDNVSDNGPTVADDNQRIQSQWKRSERYSDVVELWEKDIEDEDFVHTGSVIIAGGLLNLELQKNHKPTTMERLQERRKIVLSGSPPKICKCLPHQIEFKWKQENNTLKLYEKCTEDLDYVNTGDIDTSKIGTFNFSVAKSKDTTIGRLKDKMKELGLWKDIVIG